mmetsp:Transcript_26905/g.75633  ORF Transcript_26905/g.75633 Transcript_26905/m.75633 type:complete len:94 (-) Transcript_26905:45-326(-)
MLVEMVTPMTIGVTTGERSDQHDKTKQLQRQQDESRASRAATTTSPSYSIRECMTYDTKCAASQLTHERKKAQVCAYMHSTQTKKEKTGPCIQ